MNFHNKGSIGFFDPGLEFPSVQATNWVLHHNNVRVDLSGSCLRPNQGKKGIGRDDQGEQTAASEFDAIVETPR